MQSLRLCTGLQLTEMLQEEAQCLTGRTDTVQEIFRFLKNPRKPAILAMSRPDAKKNITTLVKAFGENPTLRELANLVLIMVSFLLQAHSRPSMTGILHEVRIYCAAVAKL